MFVNQYGFKMADVLNIALLGRRNAGKSSLINLMTGQHVSIVSPVAGTTTDPVRKRFEMPGIGAVNLIDSAGVDDEGEVGGMRVEKSLSLTKQIDFALLLYTANDFSRYERHIASELKKAEVPFVIVHNQSDIIPMDRAKSEALGRKYSVPVVEFSCAVYDEDQVKKSLDSLFARIAENVRPYVSGTILEGLVGKGDSVWLICPIDSEAPAGRLILPQVMAIRDILDRGGYASVMQPEQLAEAVQSGKLGKPDLVVTDSQVFGKVRSMVPEDWPLTGFSILLARSKGPFSHYIKGIEQIGKLKDGDRILIMESCSHHASCDDIGRVKIPALLRKHTGRNLEFDIVPSLEDTGDMTKYAMIVQCGACMITRRQLISRLKPAMDAGIPLCNYGMVLAYLNGMLERSMKVFYDRGLM